MEWMHARKACEWVINQTRTGLLNPNPETKDYSVACCVNGV